MLLHTANVPTAMRSNAAASLGVKSFGNTTARSYKQFEVRIELQCKEIRGRSQVMRRGEASQPGMDIKSVFCSCTIKKPYIINSEHDL